MNNLDFKKIKTGNFSSIIIIFIGILFLIIFNVATFGDMIKKLTMDASTQATRINSNCHDDGEGKLCQPIYYYQVDGNKYSCKANYSTYFSELSTQNMVYYKSSNPQKCLTDYTVKPNFFMYIFCIFPLFIIGWGVVETIQNYKELKKIKYLSKHGLLIQNLPYKMEPIDMKKYVVYVIAIDCQLKDGTIVHLVGNKKYATKELNEGETVELLVDPNNFNNYYIDFNIVKK